MFQFRFPELDLSDKSLHEMMGMEGIRVKNLYRECANKYGVDWKQRSFRPGALDFSDTTNKIITCCNAALYGVITSIVAALGLSPRVGFIHSGSPLPFVYDIADLYKAEISFDLAFKLTKDMGGIYIKENVANAFINRVIDNFILERCVKDICYLLEF